MLILAATIPVAFLLGSIPCAWLLGLWRGVDIRTVGSKNVGATNLGRVLGGRWFLLGFAMDALKGFVPVAAAGAMAGVLGQARPEPALAWAWLAVAIAAVLGHMFSPWVGFKGGKGVATGFGSLLGIVPGLAVPALIALAVWGAVIGVTRLMGLASVAAAVSLPISVLGLTLAGSGDHAAAGPFYAVAAGLAALVTWKHRANLSRTMRGTEPQFTLRATIPPASGAAGGAESARGEEGPGPTRPEGSG